LIGRLPAVEKWRVDSLRLPGEIRIIGARRSRNAPLRARLVQPQKVAPVLVRRIRVSVAANARTLVRHPALLFGFVRSQYVVTQPPEFLDHLTRDILVGVNARHQADSLSRI
jgi:hypothetical protein